jgi:ArsR family transcriptional regulator
MMRSTAAKLDVRPVSSFFKALGDETRLRMVALLAHSELCVCHLEAALGLSQPNVSRQLGVLRNAGVVEHRRQASWVYYRLADQPDSQRRRVLATLLASFPKRELLRADVERLLRSRGPGACT